MAAAETKRVVVVGLGMVGIAFIEKLLKYDAREHQYSITVLGEESHVAYNRVGLTSFFEHRSVENLYMNPLAWYSEQANASLNYSINTKVALINSENKSVTCENGVIVPYDILVLATGSYASLPRHTPNFDAKGVFVYRTIDDLTNLIDFAAQRKGTTGCVVGGGLLGLEAAKAMMDLDSFSAVKLVERNKWVLSRQLDREAGSMVVEQVRELGLDVLLSQRVGQIKVDEGNNVMGVVFENGEETECSTLCFAIGVTPRDELAKASGIECVERAGGIAVQDDLSTSKPDIYAIGECANWQGQTFGLIAPGVEMAEVLAFNLTQAKLHAPRAFKRPDLSTKLKLLGVNVASFGDFFADRDGPKHLPARFSKKMTNGHAKSSHDQQQQPPTVKALTYRDPFQNVYKKYIFTADGKYLLGGMMIGDTNDYIKVVPMVKNMKELDTPPSQLILGAKKDGDEDDDLPEDTQICSCHNVTKGDVVGKVKDGSCKDLASVKSCTKAGTGCGGCMPLVTTIFNKTMVSMGNEVKNYLCSHFNYSRAELYHIVMVKQLKSLPAVMREAGNDKDSSGCEMCKPAVASIFASLWNKHVMAKSTHGLQDTNDRYLGNIQRNGTYSVVPRVPAGEITPDKLLAIGQVAKEYNLYTKITGGQRIDLFGARKQDLIDIWSKLVAAGMESGHAYAKSLRTVKSCVGTTWCRFGIGDSVGMAVRLEERYKSIRAPHKIKGGVSGCVRECAEAQNKDFGLIATEKGFNIFVAGNGGAKPKHSELLAKDVPPAEVVPILDRYLMFYIRTADKLQRTARWLESLPGGIKYLQEVILDDKLGICASLESQMKELVITFFDEWAEAIKNPAMAAQFKQFHNTPDAVENVEVEQDRGQFRPVYWPKESTTENFNSIAWSSTTWEPVIEESYFDGADELPNGISATIKRGDTQLAVWRFRGKYYATQQMCPHKRAFILSDGLIGQSPGNKSGSASTTAGAGTTTQSSNGNAGDPAPWISCPHHKRNFDLQSGSCSNDTALSIATFAVQPRQDGHVYLKLPPVEELDAALGTSKWKVKSGESGESPFAELDRKIQLLGRKARKVNGVKPSINGTGIGASELMVRPMEVMAGGGGGCGSAPDW
ncbi:Nitrite reductase [NAD(P)H] [Conoideocrella luteorostrata]|uniref:Nitrite reductase [NAD(P)H] n=1 Tax=Conoideocrella luteorostrata TaxID=1105319 RepID=A0AAJ0CHT9_9HYPO|nr:Nitrite reductase [NAD(P)H] [Conoideocrella luteorostrata]